MSLYLNVWKVTDGRFRGLGCCLQLKVTWRKSVNNNLASLGFWIQLQHSHIYSEWGGKERPCVERRPCVWGRKLPQGCLRMARCWKVILLEPKLPPALLEHTAQKRNTLPGSLAQVKKDFSNRPFLFKCIIHTHEQSVSNSYDNFYINNMLRTVPTAWKRLFAS